MTTPLMQQRHDAYQTAETFILNLVTEATGQQAVSREKITQGYDNEVYRVCTDQSEVFVVRIRRYGGAAFEQEAWAIDQCRQVGVPVPEIYLVTSQVIEDQACEVMVQSKVPGRALSTIQSKLQPDDLARIWAQVGEALSLMHRIQVGGFYQRHADGQWDFPTWETIVQAAQRDRMAELPLLMMAELTAEEIDTLAAILNDWPAALTDPQPVLCHGDLGPNHLFVDSALKLTGIIDFGEFQGGQPILDFAILAMHCPEVDLAWIQQGYVNQALFDSSFPARLVHNQITLQIGYLAHYIRQSNTVEVEAAIPQLRAALAKWKEYRNSLT